MKSRHSLTFVAVVSCFLVGMAAILTKSSWGMQNASPSAIGTDFTYQGILREGEIVAEGVYDFKFSLWNAPTGGIPVGSPFFADDIEVIDGLFTLLLDFGAGAFTGDTRYLEIGVRNGGSTGPYDTFTSRQHLTAVPYAIYSNGASWSGLTGVPADIANGDNDTTYSAGTGLSLNGTQFNVDTLAIQRRITGSCSNGQAIRVINADGTVTCQTAGGMVWGTNLSGSGTGLILNSSNNWPLELSGGSDSTPDIMLGGNVGMISSSPGLSNSKLELHANNDILLDSGVDTIIDAQDDVYIIGNDAVYIDSTADTRIEAQDDVYITGNDNFYVNSTDDFELDGDENITFELGEVNGLNDYFRIYRHDIGIEVSKMLEMGEDANLWIGGSYLTNGTNSTLIQTDSYGTRKLYGIESPENWFEDFGMGQLQNGKAIVTIEPMFAETVNLTESYHVFLTPMGDCSLFVAEKTPTSFTVQAMNGQTCNVTFDYRIVAKRLGYEEIRMEEMDMPNGEVQHEED